MTSPLCPLFPSSIRDPRVKIRWGPDCGCSARLVREGVGCCLAPCPSFPFGRLTISSDLDSPVLIARVACRLRFPCIILNEAYEQLLEMKGDGREEGKKEGRKKNTSGREKRLISLTSRVNRMGKRSVRRLCHKRDIIRHNNSQLRLACENRADKGACYFFSFLT